MRDLFFTTYKQPKNLAESIKQYIVADKINDDYNHKNITGRITNTDCRVMCRITFRSINLPLDATEAEIDAAIAILLAMRMNPMNPNLIKLIQSEALEITKSSRHFYQISDREDLRLSMPLDAHMINLVVIDAIESYFSLIKERLSAQ